MYCTPCGVPAGPYKGLLAQAMMQLLSLHPTPSGRYFDGAQFTAFSSGHGYIPSGKEWVKRW